MTHSYHEALPHFDPRQILHDGCAECESRGENMERALANLDDATFERAWRRAYDWRGSGGDRDAVGLLSSAEVPLLLALWGVQVHLERRSIPIGQVPSGPPPDRSGTIYVAKSPWGETDVIAPDDVDEYRRQGYTIHGPYYRDPA